MLTEVAQNDVPSVCFVHHAISFPSRVRPHARAHTATQAQFPSHTDAKLMLREWGVSFHCTVSIYSPPPISMMTSGRHRKA